MIAGSSNVGKQSLREQISTKSSQTYHSFAINYTTNGHFNFQVYTSNDPDNKLPGVYKAIIYLYSISDKSSFEALPQIMAQVKSSLQPSPIDDGLFGARRPKEFLVLIVGN